MFFMMGITGGRKDLPFHQTMVCSRCGQCGSYSVFMTYTVLSLFFIPCFRWNRQYFVISSCCKATWRLDREKGRRIERGEDVEIRPEDLQLVNTGGWAGRYPGRDDGGRAGWYPEKDDRGQADGSSADPPWISRSRPLFKECSHCGYRTEEDFDYCPKCGNKL